jgi:hypothetical protein
MENSDVSVYSYVNGLELVASDCNCIVQIVSLSVGGTARYFVLTVIIWQFET